MKIKARNEKQQVFTEKEVKDIIFTRLNSPDSHFIEYFDIGILWFSACFKGEGRYIEVVIKHRRDSIMDKVFLIPTEETSEDESDDEVESFGSLLDEINRLHEIVEKTKARLEGY
ncbi:hypothetical protein LS72_010005 [Helicobacter apodemus]|uniref:Uncharacterized protein n=1 Tax=Helicobacter apodemus TaxID=135569 RepID=A0A4U8UBN0_9HELI|nr:hypothetical protein [Helicobacter apodemus]TLE13382.1 hypothetical protein LS72_010005 [Helicobacter apodemus]